jgi:hypothetical protein
LRTLPQKIAEGGTQLGEIDFGGAGVSAGQSARAEARGRPTCDVWGTGGRHDATNHEMTIASLMDIERMGKVFSMLLSRSLASKFLPVQGRVRIARE